VNPRRRLSALLERRLALLAPARRQRFELTIATVQRLADTRRARVLDAGCGDGLLAEAIARRNPTWRIVGLDASPTMLTQARARLASAGLENIELVEGNLTEELGGAGYDVVLAIECLSEIEEDTRALHVLAHAVAPEGLLVVQVPERDWRPVLRGSPRTWRHEVRHGYDRAELIRLIEDAGLSVIEVRGSYRRLVQLAQEIRDRIKRGPIWLRALVFPLMVLAVRLESAGLTWGREQALFAVAVRRTPAVVQDGATAAGVV
jgi:2-polyprenyl-3-methyl-5-hydroxy-6-metoxy-1,4-benzoquinol methylase